MNGSVKSSELNFSEALYLLKGSHNLQREGWNGKGQWVALQESDENSKMTDPYLYLKNAQDGLIPWVPSQGDLFATDWQIA